MNVLWRCFTIVHALMAALFTVAALMLIAIAARTGWAAFAGQWDQMSAQSIIEAIGLLAGAVVAIQIAETIVEEEVIREADVSGPTRVRRFMSRFLVVVVVALAIEGLVATFKALHQQPSELRYAAELIVATAALLAAWGVFVHLNRSAEELEPEAMEKAKREDAKVQ
ncbi:hypothetical protein F4827_003883 [Paraburkholderia bannensis]|uniref:GNAT family acetyltransferase n=1 Tax=Paraburkholderia bannensis TaxID=765414 RepID=A0A7W9WTW4_9BURK|nr:MULTISPECIES: hypothetical protein [Paraburkholderia]MBB3259009.1 hypothetical protein [Paraburkholderia sp. WP4_3_2]MBB6104024.1 hypothetical protein [Paraburkholderia bannensis]